MTLRFDDAKSILGFAYGVPPEKLKTLVARLQAWQKLDFPDGTRVGKGVKAEYGATQIFQLLLMMKLVQVGLMPERAIIIIKHGWDSFRKALGMAIRRQATGLRQPTYCAIEINSLQSLTGDKDSSAYHISWFTPHHLRLGFAWQEDVAEELLSDYLEMRTLMEATLARAIVIDVDAVVTALWNALDALDIPTDMLAPELAEWAAIPNTGERPDEIATGFSGDKSHDTVLADRNLDVAEIAARIVAQNDGGSDGERS